MFVSSVLLPVAAALCLLTIQGHGMPAKEHDLEALMYRLQSSGGDKNYADGRNRLAYENNGGDQRHHHSSVGGVGNLESAQPLRNLDSLGGGHLLRDTRNIDSLAGVTYGTQKRFDSLGGVTYGGHKRSSSMSTATNLNAQQLQQHLSPLSGGYQLYTMHHLIPPNALIDKKNFDEIDRSGFDGFVKKNFDEIDRAGFEGFVKRTQPNSNNGLNYYYYYPIPNNNYNTNNGNNNKVNGYDMLE